MWNSIQQVAESISPCGFVCAKCSRSLSGGCAGCGTNGETCPILDCCGGRKIKGCWECADFPCCECSSFRSVRIRAFLRCAHDEGAERLAEYLVRNEKNGLRYHRTPGYEGDYDGYGSVDEVLKLLHTGEKENTRLKKVDPYTSCPVYETESLLIRLVMLSDAQDLLGCYSDPAACRLMNSDNCDFGFEFHTEQEMRNCITYWLDFYEKRGFVRFTVFSKALKKAVGTLEMFAYEKKDAEYGTFGVLRLDLQTDFEQEQRIAEILKIVDDHFYELFGVEHILTKATPLAAERRSALSKAGYTPLNKKKVLPYDDYFIR